MKYALPSARQNKLLQKLNGAQLHDWLRRFSTKTITEFEVIITGLMKSGLFVKLDDGAVKDLCQTHPVQMIFTKL